VQSLLAAYDVHEKRVRASTFSFVPFPPFKQHRARLAAAITSQLSEGCYESALPLIRDLATKAEASLLYLNRYHWRMLYGVVVVSYMAWMLLLACQLARPHLALVVTDQPGCAQRAGRAAACVILGIGFVATLAMSCLRIPVCERSVCCCARA
jgi:hypothetical protein